MMFKKDESPLGLAQSVELAHLLELEACWENLVKTPDSPDAGPAMRDLHRKQKAHQAFQAKLSTYNMRHKAGPHATSIHWSTPERMGAWCRAMRDLYVRIRHDHQAGCPAHLVEKAYRIADRMALRKNVVPLGRTTPPADVAGAIRELEALALWCDDMAARQEGAVKGWRPKPPTHGPATGEPTRAATIASGRPPGAVDGPPHVPSDPEEADHVAVDLCPAVA